MVIDRDRKPLTYADLGVCVCGTATWLMSPYGLYPNRYYCLKCKRLHPMEVDRK